MNLYPLKKLLYNQYLTAQFTFGYHKDYQIGKPKNKLHILSDLLDWQLREGEFNTMYYAMGLHLQGKIQKEFIGRKSFLKLKSRAEKKLKERANCYNLNYDSITKDKFYSNSIFTANGIPCLSNVALVSSDLLIFPDGKEYEIQLLSDFKETYIIKNIELESGEGVFFCKTSKEGIEVNGELKDWSSFKTMLGHKKWVIQDQCFSHIALRKVNASALNTTRIVTILNKGNPEYLTGFQGFATNRNVIDSWKYGSVYVGLDIDNECLKKYGYTNLSDPRPGLLTYHPDSKINFMDFTVPYLKESVDLCIKAHKLLYFNFIIGWDVAITDAGPVIVEANEKPGMNVVQCMDGGMRKKIKSFAAKLQSTKT